MGRITKAKPAASKTVMLDFELVQVQTDPSQFKVYSPTLQPHGILIVQIPVDADEVIDDVTITLAGMMSILRNVSTAIDTMHHDR